MHGGLQVDASHELGAMTIHLPSGGKTYEEVLTSLRKVGARGTLLRWPQGGPAPMGPLGAQPPTHPCALGPPQGTTLQKYGRHGAPKFHYFRLGQDDTELQWESKNVRGGGVGAVGWVSWSCPDLHLTSPASHPQEAPASQFTPLPPPCPAPRRAASAACR